MKRKVTWISVAALLLCFGLSVGQAAADPIGQLSATRIDGYWSGGGGEYTIFAYGSDLTNLSYSGLTKNIGPLDPSFQSFCLEANEGISPSFFSISSGAVLGGNGGGTPDPISMGTAWLYSQFAQGSLLGYFAGTRSVEAGLLQWAIWSLEQEVAALAPGANPYYDAAIANGGTANAAPGYLGVWVLNNFDTAEHRDLYLRTGQVLGQKQDVLYYVPDGGATLMLLGGALIGIGALRRKFRG